jgi:ketosteroid isomerase-like protein
MWTRILLNVVLALGFMTSTPAMSAQSADEAAVTQAVEGWRKAILAKDKGQFEALLADQLVYGHSDGRTDTKASYIADAMSPRALWKVVDFTNQTVTVTGDTAIVRHIFTGESEREGGKMQSTKVGALTVWQKQGGRWKLLGRQAYRL